MLCLRKNETYHPHTANSKYVKGFVPCSYMRAHLPPNHPLAQVKGIFLYVSVGV